MTSDTINWYLLDSGDECRVSSRANARCTNFARVVDPDLHSRSATETLLQPYHRTSVLKSREKAAQV